jgi:hypothetical protein
MRWKAGSPSHSGERETGVQMRPRCKADSMRIVGGIIMCFVYVLIKSFLLETLDINTHRTGGMRKQKDERHLGTKPTAQLSPVLSKSD